MPSGTQQVTKENMHPILVFSKRWIDTDKKEMYDKLHQEAAEYMVNEGTVKDVKVASHWWDNQDPTMVWDVQWFGNLPSFYSHADMSNDTTKSKIMNWVMTSNMMKPYQGIVFGGYDDKVQMMTDGFKAQFIYPNTQLGFYRDVVGGAGGHPIIMVSEHVLKDGEDMDAALTEFEKDFFDEI